MAGRARPGGAREFREGGRRHEPRVPTRERGERGRARVGSRAADVHVRGAVLGARSAPTSSRPTRPRAAATRCTRSWASCTRKGALVLHGEQEFEFHRTPVAGDVLDGVQKITDIYEKETDSARHDVHRHGDAVDRRARRSSRSSPSASTSSPGSRSRTPTWDVCRTRSRSSPARARASASRTRERFLAEGAKVVVAEVIEERAGGGDEGRSTGKGDAIVRADRHLRPRAPRRLRRRDRRGVRHRRTSSSTTPRSTTTSTTSTRASSTCRRSRR